MEVDTELSLTDLINQYTQPNLAEAEDEDETPPPVPSSQQALQALQIVLQYQEHQERAQNADIQCLIRLERNILVDITSRQVQTTLDSWLT